MLDAAAPCSGMLPYQVQVTSTGYGYQLSSVAYRFQYGYSGTGIALIEGTRYCSIGTVRFGR